MANYSIGPLSKTPWPVRHSVSAHQIDVISYELSHNGFVTVDFQNIDSDNWTFINRPVPPGGTDRFQEREARGTHYWSAWDDGNSSPYQLWFSVDYAPDVLAQILKARAGIHDT